MGSPLPFAVLAVLLPMNRFGEDRAMPTRVQIEQAMQTHFDAWNALDRARWEANFASDIVFEDPVGGPTKEGVEADRLSWENSFKDGQTWHIEPVLMQVCSDQAACQVRSTGVIAGKTIVLEGIEVYTINDAGKVAYIRTWFTPPEGAVLDPYFMEAHASR
jgi:hypothetical protein